MSLCRHSDCSTPCFTGFLSFHQLLDIQREGNSTVVNLVSYAMIGDMVIPAQFVMQYLNQLQPEEIAIQLGEVVKSRPFTAGL